MSPTRRLHLSAEHLVAYSRRGNFHSDPEQAAALGYPGMVAQGMQVVGPAYGLLLDAWGEEFLAHGSLDVTFVAPVLAGTTIEATVTPGDRADRDEDRDGDGDEGASLTVVAIGADRPAVVGRARRSSSLG